MNTGKTVFAQLIDFLPLYEFRKCVERYNGNHSMKTFSCLDQYLSMAFAQLTYRDSLRDIEVCLHTMQKKLYHTGIRSKISRSTLAYANETKDWRIYCDFAHVLINEAQNLYAKEPFGLELNETVYALDSSTIDLCLSLFPWARFRRTKAAIKLHTLLNLRGNIPSFIKITDGKVNDVNILDDLIAEPGSFYIMDRGYLDFERLYRLKQELSYFVIRAKSNMKFERIYSHSVDKSTGLKCDQTIMLTGTNTDEKYPEKLRRVRYYDEINDKNLTFLTNNFELPAIKIAQLYKCRWQIELFFKWIKQHLRIKSFFGTSENAVKTQIWIAISVYVLVAIAKKKLKLEASLYTFLQFLSVALFEKTLIYQAFSKNDDISINTDIQNQLTFEQLYFGH
jgi:transposase